MPKPCNVAYEEHPMFEWQVQLCKLGAKDIFGLQFEILHWYVLESATSNVCGDYDRTGLNALHTFPPELDGAPAWARALSSRQ
jgi:hypothetical protein